MQKDGYYSMSERDPNSLCLWYPRVQPLVPTPKTEWVDFPNEWFWRIAEPEPDADNSDVEAAIERLCEAGNRIGWPCFMRTDLSSGKHQWEQTCYVPTPDDVHRNLFSLLEYNECADIMGLPYSALVIREFLECESPFNAYRGMPVTLERRLFIRDREVICDHPYWPTEAIAQGRPSDPNWADKFAELAESYCGEEATTVYEMASKVALEFDGYWSVDFLRAKDGWYLIDMALGDQSFHWEGCENA